MMDQEALILNIALPLKTVTLPGFTSFIICLIQVQNTTYIKRNTLPASPTIFHAYACGLGLLSFQGRRLLVCRDITGLDIRHQRRLAGAIIRRFQAQLEN